MLNFKRFIAEARLQTYSGGRAVTPSGEERYMIHGNRNSTIITAVSNRNPGTVRIDTLPDNPSEPPASRRELIRLYASAARAGRWASQRQVPQDQEVSVTIPMVHKDPNHPLHVDEKEVRKRLFAAAKLPFPLRPHTDFGRSNDGGEQPVHT